MKNATNIAPRSCSEEKLSTWDNLKQHVKLRSLMTMSPFACLENSPKPTGSSPVRQDIGGTGAVADKSVRLKCEYIKINGCIWFFEEKITIWYLRIYNRQGGPGQPPGGPPPHPHPRVDRPTQLPCSLKHLSEITSRNDSESFRRIGNDTTIGTTHVAHVAAWTSTAAA